AERECQFELHGDRVVLRSLGHGEFTSVNGVPVSDAVLAPGDQVVIDQHRFVLEAPGLPARGQDRLKGQVQQQHTQTMKAVRVPPSNQSPAEQRDALDPPPQPVDPGALWWLIAAAARILNGKLHVELLPGKEHSQLFCLLQIVPEDYPELVAHRRESLYRDLFLSASEGIYRSLPDGGFLDVNPALARMLGYESPA